MNYKTEVLAEDMVVHGDNFLLQAEAARAMKLEFPMEPSDQRCMEGLIEAGAISVSRIDEAICIVVNEDHDDKEAVKAFMDQVLQPKAYVV